MVKVEVTEERYEKQEKEIRIQMKLLKGTTTFKTYFEPLRQESQINKVVTRKMEKVCI